MSEVTIQPVSRPRPRYISRRAYRLPDPLHRADDLDRFYHRDIPHLTDEEYAAERFIVAEAYAYEVYRGSRQTIQAPGEPGGFVLAVDWLGERLHELDADLVHRRKGSRS